MGGWRAMVRPDWVVRWNFQSCVNLFYLLVCVKAASISIFSVSGEGE
jgi:hypothetical protein